MVVLENDEETYGNDKNLQKNTYQVKAQKTA